MTKAERKTFKRDVQAALRSSIAYPLVGDGPRTRRLLAEIEQEKKALAWSDEPQPPEGQYRVAIVEARYEDWRRSRFTLIQGGLA